MSQRDNNSLVNAHLMTKDGAEIDLIVERPGLPILFIEIKSTHDVQDMHLLTLKKMSQDFGDCEPVCFSNDPYPRKMDGITIFPWMQGLKDFSHNLILSRSNKLHQVP